MVVKSLICLCRSPVPCDVIGWYLIFDVVSHRHISYLTLTYVYLILGLLYLTYNTRHRYLPCYIWHMIPDTGTCQAILIIWYLTSVLAMLVTWYRYRYMPCYTYYLISDTSTCHAILIACYLAPNIVTLDTRPDIVAPDWLLLYLKPVLYRLCMIIILLLSLIHIWRCRRRG